MRALMLFLATAALASPQDVEFVAPAVLEGRFYDSKGEPVAGVELALDARFSPRLRGASGWTTPRTTTDEAGRFVLRAASLDAIEFELVAELPDHERLQWTWAELTPGQHIDLGDLHLPARGRVVGSILSEAGILSSGPWEVHLRLAEAPQVGAGARLPQEYSGRVDPETGEYRFERVPVGWVSVHAQLGRTETEPGYVLVREGLEEVLDLTFTGPDPALEIRVAWSFGTARALATYEGATDPDAGPRITLVSAGGERRVRAGRGAFGGEVSFSGLPSTTYRVEIDGPNHQAWALDGVRPGERVRADLVGSAALVLDVVDQGTAIPVERYGAWVVSDSRRFGFAHPDAPPPAYGFVDGLLPSTFVLAVSAPGYVPVRVPVDDLGSGERRVVRVELDRSRTLEVRVLDVDGAPAVDERVEFLAGSGDDDLVARQVLRTDAAGRARFDGLGAGPYTFVATHAPWLVSHSVLRVDDEAAVRDLAAPAHGWVDAHVLLPPNLDASTLEFLAVDGESAGAARWARGSPASSGESLRLGPLAPGVYELLARYSTPSGAFVQLELGAVAVEAGGVTAGTWDLREHCPGWVRVDPPGEAPLDVVFRWTGGRPDRHALRHGGFLFAGLDPGSWRVMVRPVLGQWVWLRPEPVTIQPGEGFTLDLGLELVERDVRVVDAGGRPVASVVVTTGPAGDRAEALWRPRPDDEGRLRLTLPAGEVRFARRDGAPSVTLDWRAGPEELVVRLPEE